MKNILSKLGTKKVAGAALAIATLLIGVGVATNFIGNNQKTENEAALSRVSDNAYNTFGGSASSRAELEKQMLAKRNMNIFILE